jgi:chitinase
MVIDGTLSIYTKCMRDNNMIAPYTDTTLWPTFDISTVPFISDFTLGFVVADKDKEASWGGYHKVDSDFYSEIISKVKNKDGNLICSFGGAAGAELATVITDHNDLFAAYDGVIKKYEFKFIDFDIEGPAVYNKKANVRRAKAITLLRRKYPKLHVSLTVPVQTYGLDKDTIDLVRTTPADLLNIMAMDFGREKDMAAAVIKAAESVHKDHSGKIGVTVMIGKNDTPEILTLKNAQTITKYVKQNSWIARFSFWAIERDQGKKGDLSHSSKIDQQPYEFSKIFKSIY